MRAVVLGAGGQLGRALRARFPDAEAYDSAALDITDRDAVLGRDWAGVGAILNAAAYTKVDAAEEPAGASAAHAVNAVAVGHLAEAARRHGVTLVHVSTEYVFDGNHRGPIPEDLPASPLSSYGRSKADGDRAARSVEAHYLVRPTWVVGEGANFVRTMAGLADRGVSPTVVDDQVGRLTFADDLAAGIAHLLATGAPFGTYNLTGAGEPASWADVAEAVFVARGRRPEDVRRTSTAQYFADKPQAAPRPLNSVLDLSRIETTGFTPRPWRDALAEYLRTL